MEPIWPLVGRGEELALVDEALRSPEVHGVVLAGEPGVGKTRLAREALGLAAPLGLRPGWAVGSHSAASIPFGALAHLLPETLLEDEGPGVPATTNILRAAADALVGGDGDAQVVLGVDDAHLLDGSSAALVQHLAATLGAFVVATVRSGEPAPDAVVALWKEGRAERVEVQALSRTETDRLVETALGSQVGAETLHRLFETTRGNPLFLREVVLGGLHAGSLVELEGVWRWTGAFEPSPRLLDVVEERLGRLGEGEREILEIVAEAEYAESGVLDPLDGRDTVEALERRGLLESWVDGRRTRVRLAHPLYGEVLRARAPPLRVRAIRRDLADAVQASGRRRREDLLRVATWRLGAGDTLRPDIAVAASRRAAEAFDYWLAERLADVALESTGSFEATRALVEALLGQGRFAEVDALLCELGDKGHPQPIRAMAAVIRATNLFWRMGQGEAAWEVLRRAEETVADPELRDELAATRATFLVFGGRTHEGIEVGTGVVERGVSDRAVTQAVPIVWGLNVTGRTREASAFVERVRGPVERVADEFPLSPSWLEINLHLARFVDGSLDEAVLGLESYHEWATENGSPARAVVPWAIAWIEQTRGRVRTARRRLREATLLLREVDLLNHLPLCLAEMARAEALLGQVDEAEVALEEAERTRLSVLRAGEGHIGLARAWVAAARGEISHAVEEALRTAEITGEMGQVVFQATALHDAARLGAAPEVAEELEEVAGRADGRMIPACAFHARALAASDAGALEEVSGAFEEMGALLYAAEAAAEAVRIHRDDGRTGSALAASAHSALLAAECEGARTPALDAAEHPLPLTPREREVATLAASELTNREIAERLVVSVRTVENHLHAVYAKLGVDGREALTPILAPQGADLTGLQT